MFLYMQSLNKILPDAGRVDIRHNAISAGGLVLSFMSVYVTE